VRTKKQLLQASYSTGRIFQGQKQACNSYVRKLNTSFASLQQLCAQVVRIYLQAVLIRCTGCTHIKTQETEIRSEIRLKNLFTLFSI